MKRALPVLVLTVAGLVPVWRYAPSDGSTTAPGTAAPGPAPSAPAPGAGGGSAQVVRGTTVDTEKGPVQVEVTFDGDEITAVRLLRQPDHPQTEAAVPKLVAATLEAQSADVDTVSGATITSDGYRESLQAAIDEAAEAARAAPSSATPVAASEVVAGSAVDTEKGTVQVEVTFEGDAIGSVRMLRQPNHPQTEAAVPKLVAATLEAQSADVDTVSGATITSDGYRESLQAAIDARG